MLVSLILTRYSQPWFGQAVLGVPLQWSPVRRGAALGGAGVQQAGWCAGGRTVFRLPWWGQEGLCGVRLGQPLGPLLAGSSFGVPPSPGLVPWSGRASHLKCLQATLS